MMKFETQVFVKINYFTCWKRAILITSLSLSFQSAGATNLCSQIFSAQINVEAKAQDLRQDFKIFGGLTYVTDGLGTVQRINPNKAFWAISDAKLRPSVELTRQLQVDKSGAENRGFTRLRIELEKPEPYLVLALGSLSKFQRDPKVYDIKLKRNIDLRYTDGLAFPISSVEVLEMKVIVSASGKYGEGDSRNLLEHFSTPQLFESPYQMIAKSEGARSSKVYWSTFQNRGGSLTLEGNVLVDKMWIIFRNPGKLKNIELALNGPITAVQDVFGESSHANPERFWRGMGRRFDFDKLTANIPKYHNKPISKDFRNKIRENLYNREYQLAAIRTLKNKTLESELKNLGFEYHIFEEKIEPAQFFKFFNFIENAKVPIESGEFGVYHGAEAHAAQIYAITRGMSGEELTLFRNLYREIGHNAFFGWKIWTSLFDSPDFQNPTSPRFWKLLEMESE